MQILKFKIAKKDIRIFVDLVPIGITVLNASLSQKY